MFLTSVQINNYRLLKDIEVAFDPSLTLIVGKNNAGKTSLINLIQAIISGKKHLDFSDYPLECRRTLYDLIYDFLSGSNGIDYECLHENIPTAKIRLTIDYSKEADEELLGGLAPFIIDIDDDTNIALIEIEYQFCLTEDKIKELFDSWPNIINIELLQKEDSADKLESEEELPLSDVYNYISQTVSKHFDMFFQIVIKAVNPSNQKKYQVKTLTQLQDLFVFKKIGAERSLDEADVNVEKPLSPIMTRLFNSDLTDVEAKIQDATEKLNTYVADINDSAQSIVNEILDDIVNKMIPFGYPNAEELQLKASTRISLQNEIINNTDLAYITSDEQESLPSTHNGLGYKNLIKIVLLLQEFTRELKKKSEHSIPILFLEEPEAHMHPQLQAVFVGYLHKVLSEMAGSSIQIILTTHSSHIANTVSFDKIRYMRRHPQHVECKNLATFYNSCQTDTEKQKNIAFLQKYLTISRCDLYFCDKAILVEGAAERLLIPDMIVKCHQRKLIGDKTPSLPSQYCSIIEVGGAYAHNFFEFVDFLEIPTLILTDIDFVDKDGKQCQVSHAVRSSNATLNRWCHDMLNIPISTSITISDIYKIVSENKKDNGLRHLEFQMMQNGIHPRSFEEAIINVNRSLFDISDDTSEIIFNTEDEKKTDFAIKLLVESKFNDYVIPSYIELGLKWLNEQSNMPMPSEPRTKKKRAYNKRKGG